MPAARQRFGHGISRFAAEDDVGDARIVVEIDARHLGSALQNPFREQKAEDERTVGSRRAHDHGERLAVQAHFEGALDGDVIDLRRRVTVAKHVDLPDSACVGVDRVGGAGHSGDS